MTTKKKRQPRTSPASLAEDMQEQRASKRGNHVTVSISIIDRWIEKAKSIERRLKHWKVESTDELQEMKGR